MATWSQESDTFLRLPCVSALHSLNFVKTMALCVHHLHTDDLLIDVRISAAAVAMVTL